MIRLLQKIPRLLPALVLLALFGLLRTPVEERLRDDLAEANLLLPPPGRDAMQQMGQSTLMGTLGGLRSLVATYLVLEAYEHFSHKDWDELRETYGIVTNLEPREESHWVSLTWHIGINATADVQTDESLPAFERERRFQKYALEAVEIAERGLEHLPDSAEIRLQLAEVYRQKLEDPCAAARVYGDMIGLEGAPGYVRRFHGYFMARCPGREEEAHDYLMSLYREGEHQHLPTLIKEIKKLEEKLDVPYPRRIPNPDPDRRPPGYPPASANGASGGIDIP